MATYGSFNQLNKKTLKEGDQIIFTSSRHGLSLSNPEYDENDDDDYRANSQSNPDEIWYTVTSYNSIINNEDSEVIYEQLELNGTILARYIVGFTNVMADSSDMNPEFMTDDDLTKMVLAIFAYLEGSDSIELKTGRNKWRTIPVSKFINIANSSVPLNESYDANIYPGMVKVGCQMISIAQVREVIAEHDKVFADIE